jgi:cobalamin biosynthesis Mg chelatase CobN
MESDAIEGLRTIDAHEAKQSLHRLNRELAKSLSRKKMRRGQPVSLSGTIVATVVVLLLAVAAFCVLYFMFHKD